MNQPPMCHPFQTDPGPQNMFQPPNSLNERSPDDGSASCHYAKSGRGHPSSPIGRRRTK